jgi:signal transduction histidine kinase
MKKGKKVKRPFSLATYLDGLLFWSVFTSATILMLWLLTSTTKNLLRESVATRVVTLSNMTAASLSPKLYNEGQGKTTLLFSDIPSEHLKAIQAQNPDIAGLVVVDTSGDGLRILAKTQTSPRMEELFRQKAKQPSFQNLVKQAQIGGQPVFSGWAFLTTREMPLFVERAQEPEYTFTAVPNWPLGDEEKTPVIILIFDAGLIQKQFLKIDDNSASVIAVAILVATILSWVVQRRSVQRQQAVEEKLAAVNLLKQRDTVLGLVAVAMDQVLADKNFEGTIVGLLEEIRQELKLFSCHVCLATGTQADAAGKSGSDGEPFVSWADLQAGSFSRHLTALQEGRTVVFTREENPSLESHLLKELDATAMALVPILFEKRLLGVMVLIDREPERKWDPGLLDSLKFAADLYGSAYARRDQEDRLLESSKVQALGRMAGGVAHEFNNLLHIISGNLEQLMRREECQPEEKELITKILEAGGRGSRIVEQLLNATRQSRSDMSSAPLNELVQKTVSLFQPVAKMDTQLELQLDPNLPNALMDVSKIQQVMLNLLLNANDAVSDQGKIRLITHLRDHEEGGTSRAFVCCEVHDNGKGIEPRNLEHIFDPFFTTKAPGLGTGLGLSTSRGILSQHGGFIDAYNAEEGGAVFAFYLPIDTVAIRTVLTKTHRLQTVDRPTSGQKGRILMADDEPLCREVMEAILKEKGYSYEMAANGVELLALARQYRGDVAWIITDWTMPGLHGAELVKQLRQQLPGVRIIVTSGFALNSQDIPEVDALIQKPFGPRELFRVMEELETAFVG